VTLQFHVESSPYVPAHSLPSDGRELFEQFRESFQQALHAELRSKACGAWRPAGYPNCKARAKISVARETTFGDLQKAIIDQMKQTEPCIDRLLGDLMPSVGQPIATLTQTLRRECFHVVSRQDRTTVYVRQVVWEGPHNPQTRLDVAQDLSPQATDEQIEQAMFSALANPRYFGRCSYCHKLLLTGQMHSPDVCQSCAEQHLGVIH
jgi:hypothetical protein